MITFIDNPKSSLVTESGSVVAWEKGTQRNFLGARNICYLDHVDGFTDVYIGLNVSKLHTLNIRSLFYANYTSRKL